MNQNKLSKWLENLQQESWNLELLISGFSIILLFQGGILIEESQDSLLLQHGENQRIPLFGIFLLMVAEIATTILSINLIVHIILRGFWIGTIGLRSVQNHIDFSQTNYSAFFKEKLSKKVPALDRLVVRIDAICSIIFSFTFMVIFMLFSLFIYLTILISCVLLLDGFLGTSSGFLYVVINVILATLIISIILSGLIYFIDTISLGFFKRFNRLSRLYYPVYLFMSFITLSFVYRSLYYSLVTRFPKTRIRLFLIPYLGLICLFPFFGMDYAVFYPDSFTQHELFSDYYDDTRVPEEVIDEASIPSRFVEGHWLPLFIRYNVDDNERILSQCNNYTPSKQGGFVSGIHFIESGGFNMSSPFVDEEDPKKLLDCLSGFYKIYLNDSLQYQKDFYYYVHPNRNEKGISTVMDINTLPVGKHILEIKTKYKNDEGNLIERNHVTIPFWKQ